MITEEERLEWIQRSFVRATADCPAEVACLLTILKYHRVDGDAEQLKAVCQADGRITLMNMRNAAIEAGLASSIGFLDMARISQPILPQVLFCNNDYGEPRYVVCYGLFGGRFIMWDPTWGVLHYTPKELELLWIKGITLFLDPTDSLREKAAKYAWWELPPYNRWLRKWKHWHEQLWLNMPMYRSICRWLE